MAGLGSLCYVISKTDEGGYDELNRMVPSNIAKEVTNYTYDALGNLVLETVKNKSVDYEYNELNQLMKKTTSANIIHLEGRRVAHNNIYKDYVLTTIQDAIGNKTGEEARDALTNVLNQLSKERWQNPRVPYRGGM